MELSDILTFISTASIEDLATTGDAMQSRHTQVTKERASGITEGCEVILDNITPKYLNGLRGTVLTVEPLTETVTISLTVESSEALANMPRSRFHILPGERYPLSSIPLATCVPI